MDTAQRLRAAIGAVLVLISLFILRAFQLSEPDLFWVALMGCGVIIFAVGSKWVLENVRRFSDYRDMWPVFCAAMVIAWLIHAVQLENYASNSALGAFFGTLTVYSTFFLLRLSNVPVMVSGDVLSFGSPSLVPAIEVTPLCGGFLSFLMFIGAFSIVTVDVGRSLGVRRLSLLLLSGAAVTFAATILRVYIVILVGFHWGMDALSTTHEYLGYILFLTVACGFWYAALTWNKRISTQTNLIKTR